jgi:hypothetical protein
MSKVDCPLAFLTPKPSFAISLNKEVRGHEGRKGRFFLGYGNIYAYTYMRVYMFTEMYKNFHLGDAIIYQNQAEI